MKNESLSFSDAYKVALTYRGAVRIRKVFGHYGLRYLAVFCIVLAVLALAASLQAFHLNIGVMPFRAMTVFFATAASMCIGGQFYALSAEMRQNRIRFFDAAVLLCAATHPSLKQFMQTRLVFQTLSRLGIGQQEQEKLFEAYPTYRIDAWKIEGEDVVLEIIRSCDPIMHQIRQRGMEERLPDALRWARRRFIVRYEARRWWSRHRLRRIPSLSSLIDRPFLPTLHRYAHQTWQEKGYAGIHSRLPLYSKAVRSIEQAMLSAQQQNLLVVSDDARAAFDAVLAFSMYVELGMVDAKLEGLEGFVIGEESYAHDFDDEKYGRIVGMVREASRCEGALLILRRLDVLSEMFYKRGADTSATFAGVLKNAKLPVIATAGAHEYHKTLETNIELMKQFDTIEIDIDDEADARGFLEDAITLAESRYDVIVTIDAVDEILKLSRQLHPGFSPSFAALEFFDDMIVELAKTQETIIDAHLIQSWFKDKGPIEATSPKEISSALEHIIESLSLHVFGQERVIEEIVTVLRTSFAGLRRDERPLASFIFCGPFGSGKTVAAQAIGTALFGADAFMEIDIADTPSSKHLEEMLASGLQHGPKVIVLQGIEHASVALRGAIVKLVEGQTEIKNTSDTVLIACVSIDDLDYFRMSHSSNEHAAMLENHGISNEFSSTFDAVVAFVPLSVEAFKNVVIRSARKASDHLREKGLTLEITPALIETLTHSLYVERYGGRGAAHTVERAIEDPVARALLSGAIRKGNTIELVDGPNGGANTGLIAKMKVL